MPTPDMPESQPPSNEPPKRMNVQGVQLNVTRTLMITGLRDGGPYVVILRGTVCRVAPRLLRWLCSLAWHLYEYPPQGWCPYTAYSNDVRATHQVTRRLRGALEDRKLIRNDRGGCYRLTVRWDDIQWHVDSLRSVVDEDLNKVLGPVLSVLDVAPPPVDDDALGE